MMNCIWQGFDSLLETYLLGLSYKYFIPFCEIIFLLTVTKIWLVLQSSNFTFPLTYGFELKKKSRKEKKTQLHSSVHVLEMSNNGITTWNHNKLPDGNYPFNGIHRQHVSIHKPPKTVGLASSPKHTRVPPEGLQRPESS